MTLAELERALRSIDVDSITVHGGDSGMVIVGGGRMATVVRSTPDEYLLERAIETFLVLFKRRELVECRSCGNPSAPADQRCPYCGTEPAP